MFKFTKKLPRLLVLMVVLLGISIITGCTLKSGPKSFAAPKQISAKPAADAPQKLTRAFITTAQEGRKFYFSGWQVTKIQKRSNQLIINGSYDREKGFVLDAKLFGQPYRYYRWGSDVYISEGDKWRKAAPTDTPMEPFADFAQLRFLADKALQLPDEVLLSKDCDVYQVTMGPAEAETAARAMGVNLPDNADPTAQDYYFDKVNMKLTVWVGKKDSFIYQYRTVTTMPLPDAGSMYQEVFYKFWDYNSSTVNVPKPEKIEKYLIKE